MTQTATPNGIQVGDQVTYRGYGTGPITGRVTELAEMGMRIRLDTPGWTVNYHECTKVSEHRKTIAGQADVRLDETDTGTWVVTIAYASTGEIAHSWATDDRQLAYDGYEMRVRVFDTGMTILAALEAMGAATAVVEPAAQVVLQPAAVGTKTTMSGAEVRIIRHAVTHTGGRIVRGAGNGRATISQLKAMARRGFVALTGQRYRPDGAVVLPWGARRAAELT